MSRPQAGEPGYDAIDFLFDMKQRERAERHAPPLSAGVVTDGEPVEIANPVKYAEGALGRAQADLEQLVQGERNHGLNAVAFSLGRLVGAGLLDRDETEAWLEQETAELWPDRDPRNCTGTIRSGLRSGEANPLEWVDAPTTPKARPLALVEAASAPQEGEKSLGETWGAVDLSATVRGLMDGTLERLAPSVGEREGGGHLFYAGKVNGLAGASGSGKSWTALTTCVQELGRGEHVVYVDLEDDAVGVVGRLLDLGVSPDAVLSRFHYVRPDEAHRPSGHDRLVALIAAHAPTIVVIDSTGEALALDGSKPNDDDDVARWFRRLPSALARLGPAVLVLDHVVKSDDGGLFAIGSQRKRAAVSGAQYMQTVQRPFARGQAGSAKLVCAKDRHGNYAQGSKVAELHVEPDGDGVGITLRVPAAVGAGDQTFRPTMLMERVSLLLEGQAEPLSRTSVHERVVGKKAALLEALDVLKTEGYVSVTPGARQSELCRSLRPYRQAADPLSDRYLGARDRVEPLRQVQTAPAQGPDPVLRKEEDRGPGQTPGCDPVPGPGGDRVGTESGEAA